MDLFDQNWENAPLAERMRPTKIADFVGQSHLISQGKILEQAIRHDSIFSMIFWGPPGSGKTTLARIIAQETKSKFIKISAVTSNVAEIKKIIAKAQEDQKFYTIRTILFIDEIHRFNKAQQDVLLPHVEKGTITLIGATTENPSFEVIGPLLSRSRVLKLEALAEEDIKSIVNRALKNIDLGLGKKKIKIASKAFLTLVISANGDARFALNTLEIAASFAKKKTINLEDIKSAIQKRINYFDKKGDYHYDTISAFIKSMRGGKTDAALHYLARMIDAGEDPIFIARRMVIFASEDIGNNQPTALVLATSTMQAVHMIGMPEATLILAQCTAYLAECPKSIASTEAISQALSDVKNQTLEAIPLHLRNAPTKLMKEFGYGKGHVRYPWMTENNDKSLKVSSLEYMPKNLIGKKYYKNPKKST
mgnify:CR=1 FL=1